jgi:hypothetical protein
MKRLLCISVLATGLFVAALSESPVEAQNLSVGRNTSRYNPYGQGYYGGYGRGYNGYYPSIGYTAYGNGPYAYGAWNAIDLPYNYDVMNNNGYGYGNPYSGYGYGYSNDAPYSGYYYGNGYGVSGYRFNAPGSLRNSRF